MSLGGGRRFWGEGVEKRVGMLGVYAIQTISYIIPTSGTIIYCALPDCSGKRIEGK